MTYLRQARKDTANVDTNNETRENSLFGTNKCWYKWRNIGPTLGDVMLTDAGLCRQGGVSSPPDGVLQHVGQHT